MNNILLDIHIMINDLLLTNDVCECLILIKKGIFIYFIHYNMQSSKFTYFKL